MYTSTVHPSTSPLLSSSHLPPPHPFSSIFKTSAKTKFYWLFLLTERCISISATLLASRTIQSTQSGSLVYAYWRAFGKFQEVPLADTQWGRKVRKDIPQNILQMLHQPCHVPEMNLTILFDEVNIKVSRFCYLTLSFLGTYSWRTFFFFFCPFFLLFLFKFTCRVWRNKTVWSTPNCH